MYASSWTGKACNEFTFIYELFILGDFQFAIASDDNSELWLSSDESPLNARLLVYVGQVCMEHEIVAVVCNVLLVDLLVNSLEFDFPEKLKRFQEINFLLLEIWATLTWKTKTHSFSQQVVV